MSLPYSEGMGVMGIWVLNTHLLLQNEDIYQEERHVLLQEIQYPSLKH